MTTIVKTKPTYMEGIRKFHEIDAEYGELSLSDLHMSKTHMDTHHSRSTTGINMRYTIVYSTPTSLG